ncbi:MAG: hypothetical protein IKF14_00335 [Atopobiaceae bacterium]|nr:hypothetical protein [Atopobiaceae bacterium]
MSIVDAAGPSWEAVAPTVAVPLVRGCPGWQAVAGMAAGTGTADGGTGCLPGDRRSEAFAAHPGR